jgi:23S rRNA pseudouridine1911/1915/1917 synthase
MRVQDLIEQQKLTVDGGHAKPSLRLRGGEKIVITGDIDRPPLKAFPEEIPLTVVYEDASIAVLNKPAGMAVHAGAGKEGSGGQGTLVNALLHRFGKLSQVGGPIRPGIVHRLDKQTSGLLVVAKTEKAHHVLAQQFLQRRIQKTYIGLVHGWITPSKGTTRLPVSRDRIRRNRMTTRRAAGREAVTHWNTLEKIEGPYGKFSLLDIKIETGRTHQIRVHLSSLGHAIVGDRLYGAPAEIPSVVKDKKPAILKRYFLHAATLQFEHPNRHTPLSLTQPLPPELVGFLQQIGGKPSVLQGL